MSKKKPDASPLVVDEANLLTMIDTVGASATLEMINSQAAKAAADNANAEYRRGREDEKRYLTFWDRFGLAAGLAVGAWGILCVCLLASHWVQMESRRFPDALHACSQGRIVDCQIAVKARTGLSGSDDEGRALKSAYLVGTGKTLPVMPK